MQTLAQLFGPGSKRAIQDSADAFWTRLIFLFICSTFIWWLDPLYCALWACAVLVLEIDGQRIARRVRAGGEDRAVVSFMVRSFLITGVWVGGPGRLWLSSVAGAREVATLWMAGVLVYQLTFSYRSLAAAAVTGCWTVAGLLAAPFIVPDLAWPMRLMLAFVSLNLLAFSARALQTFWKREREIERYQDDLKDQTRRAEQASRAKSDFLATVSHEIRTPLNGVLGMGHALLRGDLRPAERDKVQTIVTAGETLHALLSDILDMSKIEAGKLVLTPAPTDLTALIQDAAGIWRQAAYDKGLGFRLTLHDHGARYALVDATRLRQVIGNLVSNAVKFTERGEVRVLMHAGADRLRVTVEDTGPGLSEAALERLFQPFVQSDAGLSKGRSGTGLGLAISRNIAEAMGGALTVVSEVGRGSSFTLETPLTACAAPDPVLETLFVDGPKLDHRLHVLAVEDNLVNQKVLSALLAEAPVALAFAEDGAAGLRQAGLRAFDLILMDLHMPVMDGFDAAQRIRGSGGPNAGTPIVALTAGVSEHERRRCEALGFDGFLTKPVQPAELFEVLARIGRAPREIDPANLALFG